MSTYRNILAVVDLSPDGAIVAARAQAQASASAGCSVKLLHVVEYVPVEPMGEALLPAVQIEGELVDRANQRIAKLAADLGLESAKRIVHTGNIKSEVVRIAQEHNADLIVIGSRERHGVSILFNFTEDTVLHAAPCDVLAVRLTK